MTAGERLKAERRGRRAEWLAALYLRLTLHRILATRYRTPFGEIDIVATRGGDLVFVEVKARRARGGEAEALEAVDVRRIIRAAEAWLARNPRLVHRSMRFDVIFLAPWRLPRHIRSAFVP